MPPCPLQLKFFIFSILVLLVVWDRDSPAALCFDLARVFLQGATMPPLHPRKKFFFLFLVPLVVWLAGALNPAKRWRLMTTRDPSHRVQRPKGWDDLSAWRREWNNIITDYLGYGEVNICHPKAASRLDVLYGESVESIREFINSCGSRK
jgi:hypothetical protein